MAPSASMLFLSYPKLHHGPAAVEAEAPHGKGAGGFRFSFRNVFSSSGVMAPARRDAAPEVVAGAEVVKQSGCRAGGDRDAEKAAALGSKFEEAVELSCWSS